MSERIKPSNVVLTEENTDMRLISPQHLYDNPKEWLNVPHELHESLLRLMSHIFPNFKNKLKELGCHCFVCEDKPVIHLTNGTQIIGYVERPEKLLNIHHAECGCGGKATHWHDDDVKHPTPCCGGEMCCSSAEI